MRNDMRKVLIERPRFGHHRCYHDIRARQNRADLDDLPAKEGMRRPYGEDRKEFSDLLGPLRRFLWSCRGRRWDDVWSEICAQLSNNTVDSHLISHVRQMIVTNTTMIDGVICERGRFFGFQEITGLYVHPVTGLVCGDMAEPRKKSVKPIIVDGIAYDKGADNVLRARSGWMRWRNRSSSQAKPYSRLIIGQENEAVYVDGFWYWVIFASVPPPTEIPTSTGSYLVHHEGRDFITGQVVVKPGSKYRADKRQMSSADMRRHNLTNE